MNASTIIVLAIVVLLAGLALWSIIKTKKTGGGCTGCNGCGGGCSHCEAQKGK